MYSHPPHSPQPHISRNPRELAAALSGISTLQFQLLGLTEMAYAKPVYQTAGAASYEIHAADGSPLAEVDDLDTALALVSEHNMILLPVH